MIAEKIESCLLFILLDFMVYRSTIDFLRPIDYSAGTPYIDFNVLLTYTLNYKI